MKAIRLRLVGLTVFSALVVCGCGTSQQDRDEFSRVFASSPDTVRNLHVSANEGWQDRFVTMTFQSDAEPALRPEFGVAKVLHYSAGHIEGDSIPSGGVSQHMMADRAANAERERMGAYDRDVKYFGAKGHVYILRDSLHQNYLVVRQ
jgi:hypothetical protein